MEAQLPERLIRSSNRQKVLNFCTLAVYDKAIRTVIRYMLSNEKMKGDALIQKSYGTDFLDKKRRKNKGEVQQYYVAGGHEAILCKSRKSAERTLENIVPFITEKLFLKVNLQKTTVCHISKVKYLGYGFYRYKGKCRFRVHPKSVETMEKSANEVQNAEGSPYAGVEGTQNG